MDLEKTFQELINALFKRIDTSLVLGLVIIMEAFKNSLNHRRGKRRKKKIHSVVWLIVDFIGAVLLSLIGYGTTGFKDFTIWKMSERIFVYMAAIVFVYHTYKMIKEKFFTPKEDKK